ncbi:transposase [Collinsella ihumii]|uniref:transposase n=1 Tax=Collinsella ihumii TaxID=1720204 RepID=UPI0025AB1C46|nr:transposase [Collinsella ihumii]MDN0055558.1 hypothetical protein [Collinsella ihumii]
MARPKLTEELIDRMVELKGDGLSNRDICCAVGIHEATLYRWVGEPRTKLQRALCERLKKAEAAYKRTLLDTIRSAALSRSQYWTAAAWLLERKYPEEFGKAERKGDDARADAAPRIVLGVVAQPVQETLPLDAAGALPGDGLGEGSSNG